MDLGDAQALLCTESVPQLIVFLKKTADTAGVAAGPAGLRRLPPPCTA